MVRKCSILLAMFILLAATAVYQTAGAAASLKPGTKGASVKDLQYRLTILGYYGHDIVPYYGSVTENAVIKFQKGAGLEVDGIAGSDTMHALKKVSASKSDIAKLARIIYAEGRGESYKGQIAIGAVVLNRVKSSMFPNTVKDVIFSDNAFSSVSDGQYWLLPDATALKAAKAAAVGNDPSNDALYFYNPSVTSSEWMLSRKVTAKIGNHVFAK